MSVEAAAGWGRGPGSTRTTLCPRFFNSIAEVTPLIPAPTTITITIASGSKHLTVVPVPVALKALGRVVFSFQLQEFWQLRIAIQDLFAPGEPMVGQVITSVSRGCQIDQPSEGIGRLFNSHRGV